MFMSPFLLKEFSEEEIVNIRKKYRPILEGLDNNEKEDKLVELVSKGKITADIALFLSNVDKPIS